MHFFLFFFLGGWSQGFPYYITHWTWGFSTPDLLRLPFFSRKFPFQASFRKLQTKPIWVEPFAQNVHKTIQKPIKNTFLPQDSGIIFLHPALICSLNIEIRLDFEANQPLQQVIPNLQVACALSGETRVAEGEILVWAQLARSWLAGWAHARISPPSPSPSSLQPVQRLRMIFHKPEWTVYSCEKVCEVNQPSYLLGHQWPPLIWNRGDKWPPRKLGISTIPPEAMKGNIRRLFQSHRSEVSLQFHAPTLGDWSPTTLAGMMRTTFTPKVARIIVSFTRPDGSRLTLARFGGQLHFADFPWASLQS